ncbi:MAG: hypothetical protein ACJ8MR_06150, partial [Povalibacter sp.]
IAENAALLVDPDSVDHIADGMARLLEDETLRDKLRAAGQERAKRFTWERTAAEVLSVLESISAEGKLAQSSAQPASVSQVHSTQDAIAAAFSKSSNAAITAK